MSQPFSGVPDPGTPRPFKRSIQPGVVQNAMQRAMSRVRPFSENALRSAKRYGNDAVRGARRQAEELQRRVRRNPRGFGVAGAAVAVTLVGAIALSATGASRSLCPPASDGKKAAFNLLMDPIPPAKAGGEIEIHYDICGLPSGAPYSGRIRLLHQKPSGKKKGAKPKPVVVTFKNESDGPATRREQELKLASVKPGGYTLELSVADKQGRERKQVQKVWIKKP
jgi:hypothetical protein